MENFYYSPPLYGRIKHAYDAGFNPQFKGETSLNRHRFSFLMGLAAAFLLNGCAAAPGMYLGASAPDDGSVDTSAVVNGLRVHLQSLTPQTASGYARAGRAVQKLPDALTQYRPETYRLGVGDVVSVTVWEHPELTSPLGQYRSDLATGQMVDDAGNIFYPYAGTLPAKGLTANELRGKLLKVLSKVLNNPQVDVKVTGFRSQKVYVHGGVVRPGAVYLTDVPLTLLDAVNQAGGVLPASNGGVNGGSGGGDGSHIELQRDGKAMTVDLYADYGGGTDPSRVYLKDGDVIRVATRDEGKVYVLGEVSGAKVLTFSNGRLSLAQAIGEAGGISAMSAEGRGIYVIRLRDTASVDLFHLNARNPLALAVGDQFPLQPHDIVWVDASGLARWNRVVSLVLPTANLYYYLMLGTSSTKSLYDDFSK